MLSATVALFYVMYRFYVIIPWCYDDDDDDDDDNDDDDDDDDDD